MSNKNFPQQIFTTDDGWGDEYHFNEAGMEENIESLKSIGDEWKSISIDDCTSYWLEETHGNRAIYREENCRGDAFVVFEHGDNDTFSWISGAHDTIEWAREMAVD